MIELKNVCVEAGGHKILDHLNLKLSEKRIAIIGANGSGKSTFVRLLNGLRLPTSGEVLVDSLDSRKYGKDIRRKVGFVFQNPDNQIVMPVVEEDLAFGLKNIGVEKAEIARRIDYVLDRFNLQAARLQSVQSLSGGQRQLVALCGVIVMEPEIIVFDEPTTQLDLSNKRKMTETIFGLSQQVIVVSHDLDMLKNFDRVIVIDHGRVVHDDIPEKSISYYEEAMA
ncbi:MULTISPECIES: energy-coupling factor ABC transporter ATP-binding protein [Bartonella]|uniref:energy-coupling factor ABC transporter ATP-binding protein n=1 Tax=Bartonella TaxID=773 RepID=UPI0018DB8A66|nr:MULTISPECIES: ABC transporter ATP-binding protein [Bartonella]MBH9974912.1 ABC transporter ATP-binding protein [Bartonella choladocola]MBI0014518.1 ABC transporter ATP-binding protein [Bartonella sp. B10834G3]